MILFYFFLSKEHEGNLHERLTNFVSEKYFLINIPISFYKRHNMEFYVVGYLVNYRTISAHFHFIHKLCSRNLPF